MTFMSPIHPTALVSPKCRMGENVRIGPFCLIEDEVSIGDNTTLLERVHVGQGTTMGKNNFIHMGAVIGHEAQARGSHGIQSFLKVGDNNVFREYVTVHRGATEQSQTRIGDDNYFMAFSHVGHDCDLKNHVTVTNAVLLGGHVMLDDHCMLGGGSAVHQFCRIGSYAMIGGKASVTKDVPPYMLIDDNEDLIGSMNLIGLRRAGFSEEVKREIKNAYRLLYMSGLSTPHALEAILKACHTKEVAHLADFIKNSKRGILGHRKQKEV